VIKFVIDLPQVGGFLQVLRVSSSNKTDRHDINETLLKVALKHHQTSNIKMEHPGHTGLGWSSYTWPSTSRVTLS
jgi:hypothetical protein